MKKLLSVVPALLLFAMIGVPSASADSYTVTFACTGPFAMNCSPLGIPPPTATDASFPGGNFDVTVSDPHTSTSATFNVVLPPTFAPTDTYAWVFNTSAGSSGFVTDTLEIANITVPLNEFYYVSGSTDNLPVYCFGECGAAGSLTFSPVAASTPEPASVFLILLGAGLIFFIHRRFVMHMPLTA